MRTARAREGNLKRDRRLGARTIAAEHAFMIETVGQALGEYGDMIIDHIEKKIAEEVGKLRAEVNLKRASDDGDVVRAAESAAQVSVGREATAELKPRILRKQSTSSLVHCVNDSHSLYAHSGHAT